MFESGQGLRSSADTHLQDLACAVKILQPFHPPSSKPLTPGRAFPRPLRAINNKIKAERE